MKDVHTFSAPHFDILALPLTDVPSVSERRHTCTKKVGFVRVDHGLKTLDKVLSAQLLHILFSFTRPQRECTALIYRPRVTVTMNYSPYSLLECVSEMLSLTRYIYKSANGGRFPVVHQNMWPDDEQT